MKYEKGFSVLAAVLIGAVIAVAIGGYVWYKTAPTSTTQTISEAVFPAVVPAGTSPIVKAVEQKVSEHTAQAVLNSLDQQRQQGANQRIQSQLGSFRAQAEVYFYNQTPNSYGIPVTGTAGCSNKGSIFASNIYTGNANYQAPLDPNDYPSGIELTCNVSADGQSYAIESSLLGGGYWCVDSSNHLTSGGQSKAEAVSLGTQTKCQ